MYLEYVVCAGFGTPGVLAVPQPSSSGSAGSSCLTSLWYGSPNKTYLSVAGSLSPCDILKGNIHWLASNVVLSCFAAAFISSIRLYNTS